MIEERVITVGGNLGFLETCSRAVYSTPFMRTPWNYTPTALTTIVLTKLRPNSSSHLLMGELKVLEAQ